MQFIQFYNYLKTVALDFGDLSVAPLQNTVHMGVVNFRDVFPPCSILYHYFYQYNKVSTIDFTINPLTTDDECTHHVTFATCYQLAQSL